MTFSDMNKGYHSPSHWSHHNFKTHTRTTWMGSRSIGLVGAKKVTAQWKALKQNREDEAKCQPSNTLLFGRTPSNVHCSHYLTSPGHPSCPWCVHENECDSGMWWSSNSYSALRPYQPEWEMQCWCSFFHLQLWCGESFCTFIIL